MIYSLYFTEIQTSTVKNHQQKSSTDQWIGVKKHWLISGNGYSLNIIPYTNNLSIWCIPGNEKWHTL